MSEDITNHDIMRAITELANDLSKTKIELKQDMTKLKEDISKLDKKVDLTNRKFSVVSENHLTQQAEIRELQSVNHLI